MGITLREYLVIFGALIIIGIVIFYRSSDRSSPNARSERKQKKSRLQNSERIEPMVADEKENIPTHFAPDQKEDYTDFLSSVKVDADDILKSEPSFEPFLNPLKDQSKQVAPDFEGENMPIIEKPATTKKIQPESLNSLKNQEVDSKQSHKHHKQKRHKTEDVSIEEIAHLPNEVIVLTVMSKQEGFAGPDLLRAVIACGMRFGDMEIFHRYEGNTGEGEIQFSMTNAVYPGTFDLAMIEQFSTPGVTFFLTMPGPKDLMNAYNLMSETAQYLAKKLDGEIFDEHRNPLTKQMAEHYRQRVLDFGRRQLSRRS